MRIAREQANPLALHLDEEAEKKQLAAAWKKVEAIAEEGKPGMAATLGTRDGRWNFVIVVPSIKFSDMGKGQALVNRVKSVVERANPAAAGLRVKYAGALEILMEQHRVMSMDMVKATIISILFGVLIVAGVTRRIHAPFYIATSLLIGIVWTFAVARLLVGHVNIITGFLVSVLIGLGIDFGIHLYMRFVQEARAKDASPEDVFVAFITGTITPAMTAAATTAAVFFTFTIADFRGFSEFGLIAGIGVIFTLISTFLVFPPLIALFEQRRIADIARRAPDDKALRGRRIPLSASIAIIAALSIPAVCGIFGAIHMPFRNDFRQLRGYSDATAFSDYVDRHLGAGFNPAVFVADSIDDARRIGSRLRKAHEKDATRDIPVRVGRVLAASDLVPADVDAHRQRIEKIAQIVNAPSLNRAAEQETPQGEKLRNARKMVTTGPWTLDEVPVEFRRRFQTIDQPVGYLVYAWSAGPHDADYLAAAWEDRLKGISRSLRADGVSHAMADETHILSWVYRLVRKDALPLLLISALSVIGLVALDFRNLRDTVLLVLKIGRAHV